MDTIWAWLDTAEGTCALFGFCFYALLALWRKASARWVNWHPVLHKSVRWSLYGFSFVVAVLFFQALGVGVFSYPNALWAVGGAGTVPLVNLLLSSLNRRERIRRGAVVGDVRQVNSLAHKQLPRADFKESFDIGGVDIPRSAEPYHFLVVGSTGSGKSVAISRMLDSLEARGDLVLVVDSGGEFCSRYYREGRDHIINPFDDRCAPWSPTSEMKGPWDAEALAKSMIPDGVGDSKEWNGYAQVFVTAILRKLSEEGRLSIKDLLYYAQAASMEELKVFLANTAAAAQLVSDKTFGSIRTIVSTYLSTYAYLTDNDEPFSVAEFILQDQSGFLFLTYRDDQLDSLRNMISCVLDVAARTILAMPANPDRRVWLIIDEFASIGKVQSIEAVATKARKVGGCLLLGLQAVSQLKDRYGEHSAQTILSCLSSWLVLRCSDADTAEYISKYIGDSEVSRMTVGESSSDTGGSSSLNEQIQTQRAVMPVELQKLKNLAGFFKLAGNYPICNIFLPFPAKRPKAAVNYASRDFRAKPMLALAPSTESQATAASGGQAQGVPQVESCVPQKVDMPPVEAAPVVIKVRKNPLTAGPLALMEVLEDMALEHEQGQEHEQEV